ncbi:MAG: hypothetical protein K6D37_12680 [Prevotella sp.]|nr:hypothetical protein [Prevotella sp.]
MTHSTNPSSAETCKPQASTPPTPSSGEPLPVPRKVKGTLTIKSDDDMEFRAQRKTGISSQEVLATRGDAKFYRTVGERKPKYVAHLVTPADSPDPVADMQAQLDKLTEGMQTKRRPKLRGRLLLDNPSCRIVHNQKEGRVQCILDINLRETPDIQGQLIRLLQTLSSCFAINQTSLVPPKS